MSRIKQIASAAAVSGLILCGTAAATVQRTFVASYGNDANVAANCTFASPCRGFSAAQSVTTAGGEVVALDAAGYGAITIDRSVTLTANPGFYAGIAAGTGNAITIATAGVKVTLRGLNINGVGATSGIVMTNGTNLSVENCVISGFSSDGVVLNSAGASVSIANSVVRSNGHAGINVQAGNVDISNSRFVFNNFIGVWANTPSSGTVNVIVSDTVSSSNIWGFIAYTGANLMLTRVTAAGNATTGVQTEGGILTVAFSNISGNGYGMANLSGTLETMNNNLLRGNGTQVYGSTTGIVGSGITPNGPVTNTTGG